MRSLVYWRLAPKIETCENALKLVESTPSELTARASIDEENCANLVSLVPELILTRLYCKIQDLDPDFYQRKSCTVLHVHDIIQFSVGEITLVTLYRNWVNPSVCVCAVACSCKLKVMGYSLGITFNCAFALTTVHGL